MLAPLAIGVGLTLAERFLLPSRNNRSGNRQKPDYTGAGFGDLIPWVYGVTTVGEAVVYKSKIEGSRKGKAQQKGKGGGSYVSAVVVICQGEINGVSKIFANNKLIYANTPFAAQDYLTNSCDRWKIYRGTSTQGIDPLVADKFGAEATALRGLAYLVVEDWNVEDLGGELPQLRFETVRYMHSTPSNQFDPELGTVKQKANLIGSGISPIYPTVGATVPNGVATWNAIPTMTLHNGTSAVIAPNTPYPGAPSTNVPLQTNNTTVEFTVGLGGLVDVSLLSPVEFEGTSTSLSELYAVGYDQSWVTGITAIGAGYQIDLLIVQGANTWTVPGALLNSNKSDQGPGSYTNHYSSVKSRPTSVNPLGVTDFVNFSPEVPFRLGHRIRVTPTGVDPFWSPAPNKLRVGLPGELSALGKNVGNTLLTDVGEGFLYYKPRSKKYSTSPWYQAETALMSIRVVQTKNGVEPVLPLPILDPKFAVLGAYIEYQTVPIPNISGDTPADNEGRVVLYLYDAATGLHSTLPITGYTQSYGQWHHYGQLVGVNYEHAVPLAIAPQLQLVYAGETSGRRLPTLAVLSQPVGNLDYYPAPRQDHEAYPNSPGYLSEYARAIPLAEIVRALINDYPTLGEVFSDQGFENMGGDYDPEGTVREIYGYQIRDSVNVWQHMSRLYNLFDIDLVEFGSGRLSVVTPEQSSLVDVSYDHLVRKEDSDTGNLEVAWTLKAASYVDTPSEVRLTFRDVGRDGESSLALYRNPTTPGISNTTTINTEATMAFPTCQALARRHLYKSLGRSLIYELSLSREEFGRFTVGDRIRIVLPNPIAFTNGWTFEDEVILSVEGIDIDEHLVSHVSGVLADTLNIRPVIPTSIITNQIPPGIPPSINYETKILEVPLLDSPTNPLILGHVGVVPGVPNIPTKASLRKALQTPSVGVGTETIVDLDALGTNDWDTAISTVDVPPIPGFRARNFKVTIPNFVQVLGWQNYSEFQFLSGQGTYIMYQGVLYRFKNASVVGGSWEFTDAIGGISGTYAPSNFLSWPLMLGETYELQTDTPAEIGVTRLIREWHALNNQSTSPQKPFTQNAQSAKPYKPTGLRYGITDARQVKLSWHGHVLGQGKRLGGRHPVGISLGQSYLVEVNVPSIPTTVSTVVSAPEFVVSGVPGQINVVVIRQRGDFGLLSEPLQISFTYPT